MALKRPNPVAVDLGSDVAGADPGWASRWPTLCSHLFDTRFDDGTSRVTSTLMLLAEQGVAKVCLNDREAERSTWVSGRSLDEALDALEMGLLNDRLDWRARQPSRGNGKRGR